MKTVTPASEAELVSLLARVVLRDSGALQQLYHLTAARLFGAILRIQPDRDAAADALQETFLAVWQQADRYRATVGHPMAWLLTIARNRAIDGLRAARRWTAHDAERAAAISPPEDETFSADSAPYHEGQESERDDSDENAWHRRHTHQRLHDCLHQLPATQRQSIVMAYMHGLTHQELAERLQAPLGSVKSWVRRALMGLRDCLQHTKHPL